MAPWRRPDGRLVRGFRVGRLTPSAMTGLEEWSSLVRHTGAARAQNSAYGRLRHFLRRALTMSSYLVTGGAGFIGSHLAEELTRRGERVRVVDSLITGKRKNLAQLPGVEFIEGD